MALYIKEDWKKGNKEREREREICFFILFFYDENIIQ